MIRGPKSIKRGIPFKRRWLTSVMTRLLTNLLEMLRFKSSNWTNPAVKNSPKNKPIELMTKIRNHRARARSYQSNKYSTS